MNNQEPNPDAINLNTINLNAIMEPSIGIINKKISENHWLTQLAGATLNGNLRNYPVPEGLSNGFPECRMSHNFGKTVSAELLAISKHRDINVFKIFLVAIATVISRNFQYGNFTVNTSGFTFNNPSGAPGKGLLFFLFKISEDTTVKDVLKSIHEQILSGISHQEYDLNTLLDRYEANNLGPGKSLLNFGLFYDKHCSINSGFVRNSLQFILTNKDDCFYLESAWDTGLYEASFIQYLSNHIAAFLEYMKDNLDRKIKDCRITNEAEENAVLNLSDNTARIWENKDSVLPLILRQVQLNPGKIALVHGDRMIDYATLYRRAAIVGHFLQSNLKTRQEQIIALIITPSEMTIISMLGVMMSGCAFLPIDAQSPKERITSVLDDSRCKIILTNTEIPFTVDTAVSYRMDDILSLGYNETEAPCTPINGDQLACVLYTSGTMGRPKGVLWEHRSLCNHINWFNAEFEISALDSTILATSYTFDGCHAYIWSLLTAGGTLHILDSQFIDPVLIVRCLIREKITFLKLVPTVFSEILKIPVFLSHPLSAHLRFIMLGGEVIRLGDLKVLFSGFPDIHVVNHYGPTENTIGSCFYRIARDNLGDFIRQPVIGAPLPNVKAYILNDRLQLSAFFEKGQIAVGGVSLAKRGYLNIPGLTREKFIPNPFNPFEFIYKTGDYGRWLPNGTIEFLGRIDGQVKVGGIRIELGEIESILLKLEKVSQCIVVLADLGAIDPVLVAYVVATEHLDTSYFSEFLKDFLPPAMTPGIYIQLDRLPMTSRGKVDRKALPLPAREQNNKDNSSGPENNVQRELWKIWEKLLVTDRFDLDQNFFGLGGNSLKSIQMTLAINRSFDVELQLNDVFQNPTIRRLAQIIEARQNQARLGIKPLPEADHYDTSSTQKGIWTVSQTEEGTLAYSSHYSFRIDGDLDISALQKAFDTLILRFEILRTSFTVIQGDLRQIVHPSMYSRINIVDISKIPDRDTIIDDILNNAGAEPFQLDQGPLIRPTLVITDSNKYLLLLSLHHIISDEWSLNVIINELISFYTAHLTNGLHAIRPMQTQFKDYVGWLNRKLSGETLKQHEDFWLNRFSTGVPLLDIPTDFLRPKQLTHEGGLISHAISGGSLENITEFCKRKEITLSVYLLSAVYLILYKYSGTRDLVIGLPVSGRVNEELETQIGPFLNMVLLNTSIDTDLSFEQFLRHVNTELLNVYNFQLYPLDALAGRINYTRDRSRNGLFDILVDFHLDHEIFAKPAIDHLTIAPLLAAHKYSQYDLSLEFLQTTRDLAISVSYNTRLFKAESILRFIAQFEYLVNDLYRNDQLCLKEIALPSSSSAAPSPPLSPAGSSTVLDNDLHPLPPRVIGQIYQYSQARLLIATGDLGYRLEDGTICFAARKHDGIESTGTNLNLQFVEDLLNGIDDIDCAVIVPSVDATGHIFTHAFYTSGSGWIAESPGNQSEADLNRLKDLIPAYLYPSGFTRVEILKRSSDNRIDLDYLRTLPQANRAGSLQAAAAATISPFITPGNPDDQLVRIWNNILCPLEPAFADNFFLAGGNSIKAIQLMTQIYKELNCRLTLNDIFEHPTLEQLDILLKKRHKESFKAIPSLPSASRYPASHAQSQIWILSQSDVAAITQNMMDIYPLNIHYDLNLLKSALDLLLERHEILRTVFQFADGELYQVVRPLKDLGFTVGEVLFNNPETVDSDVNGFFIEYGRLKFDLVTGPMVRAVILKPAGYCPTLVISTSHIIGDGLSADLLFGDFMAIYDRLLKDEPQSLAPLRIQYKDFSAWHNNMLSGKQRQKFKTFWAQTLDTGNVPRTELPLDFKRPDIRGHKGDAIHFGLDKQQTDAISLISRGQQATVFMFHLAVFNLLLCKTLSQNDIVIGVPVGGRPHADLDNQVGLYLNSVPLRTKLNREEPFVAVLQKIKVNLTAAMEMQLYPFDLLIVDLNITRPANGGNPLFDIVFNWIDQKDPPSHVWQSPNLPQFPLDTTTTTSKHDLMATGSVQPEATLLSFDYDTEIFQHRSIVELTSQYRELIHRILRNPDENLNNLLTSETVRSTDIAHYF
jgi:amino acid adenylation domain-containing protein